MISGFEYDQFLIHCNKLIIDSTNSCHFVGVSLCVYVFGKVSMAHFNPAVTIDYLITTHLPKNLITCYLGAEILGAILASIFVKYAIGTNANLGANVPNYNFPLPIIFGIEVFFFLAKDSYLACDIHKRIVRI